MDDNDAPKDEYLHLYIASKVEAKKIVGNPGFQEVVSKFWQLIRTDEQCDLSKVTVSKQQYKGLMKRIYKVLLPLYKDGEMDAEIEQEWDMDRTNQDELTLHLFTKLLFRIAHQWATHINLEEYVELLEKIYMRITVRRVIQATTGKPIVCHPTIQCEVLPPDPEGGIDPFTSAEGEDAAMWEPCLSDEEEDEQFEYQYVENPDTLTVKKHKKRQALAPEGGDENGIDLDSIPMFPSKEPMIYREEVTYHQNSGDYRPSGDDLVSYILADIHNVLPFGYPTEQFITWMRNDVWSRCEESKRIRKEAIAKMRLEALQTGNALRNPDAKLKTEEDTGLVAIQGRILRLPFDIISNSRDCRVRAKAKVVDSLYNSLRQVAKDIKTVTLRMEMLNPRPALINGTTKTRAPVGGTEPTTEINKFGHNPALERRLKYKLVPLFTQNNKQVFLNINYMYEHPDNQTAYRCDVEKTENSDKLAIKQHDEFKRDEDFVAVETSYKKMRQIMLSKKFETLYTENLNADENDLKRLDKVADREEQRRRQVRTAEPLNTKGVGETYEEKSLIKMMKGPFYQYASRAGLSEDDFVNCRTQDLIDFATTPAARIFLIGKPRSGKTTLAKALAARLDLVHINVNNWLLRLQEKIKNYEPPEVEEGEEPPKWLTDLEESVNDALKSGKGPSQEHTVAILKEEIHSAEAKTKGFVLDLTFYKSSDSWAKIIRSQELLGAPDEQGRQIEFSHVIELDCDDDEVKLRAAHMRLDAEDGAVYSRWEISERNKPKPKKYDDEGNEIEEEEPEEGEDVVKPLDEMTLVTRVEDTASFVTTELAHYNSNERPAMDDMLVRLFNHQYLKLDAAGLRPDELADAAEWRLRPDETVPLRPVAKKLEAGDFKSLLTEPEPGVEDPPEGVLARTWSLWKQTDPVALYNGTVVPGVPDNAVTYANNVFVFASEPEGESKNMQAFLQEPKKYLESAPQMPASYRLLMIGPRGIGTHTQAALLQEQYGWQVVDYQQLVKSRLEAILSAEGHLPNNVVPGRSQVGLSEAEIAEIRSGKPFPSWRFIPWVLDHLGYELMRRPPPPEAEQAVVDPNELDPEARAKWEKEQKLKAAAAAKKAKELELEAAAKAEREKKRQELEAAGGTASELAAYDSDPEDVKVDDLSIDELVLAVDEETGKAPSVGGFILLGFPQTELHANKLKEHGIAFDRVLYLTDPGDEEAGTPAGKDVSARMVDVDRHYDWEAEAGRAAAIVAMAKEFIGEDIVSEINASGSIDAVAIKIRNDIDPFFLRVDNPEDVRVSADLPERERDEVTGEFANPDEKRLPKGDFGDYCPVTYVNEGFLAKGNPELEVTVHGKTYLFAGEKELEDFKVNPAKFLVAQEGIATLPLEPPAPKVMIVGTKGSGVTTQIRMLCEKYKLSEFRLKDEFLAKMKAEKDVRKRRRLLDRGFKPPQPAEEEGEEPPPDAEIEDDPEDFDKEAHERDILRQILDSQKGLIIDGTWNGFPEDAVTAVEGGQYAKMLCDARRAPELVIVLKCQEAAAFKRLIDVDATKAEYERLMKEREEAAKKLRAEERAAKLAEVEEGINAEEEMSAAEKEAAVKAEMEKWDTERDEAEEAAAEEEDPDRPNLEEMLAKHEETIRTQIEADTTFLEEFVAELKDKGIPVIPDLKSDTSAEFVFIKMTNDARLKQHFQMRPDLIERQQAQRLSLTELPFYEQSYTYQQSKFGRNSPLSLSNPNKVRNHAVLYRERIFYLSSADEQAKFLDEPSKFTKDVESVPLDVQIKPRVVVLGLPKSGKSTLCSRISEDTGAVHLQMDEIIEQYIGRDCAQCERLRKGMKQEGRGIDDQLMVQLLAKRSQARDCLQNGWVIEDFPRTKAQATLMAKSGLSPANVFYIRVSHEEVYSRTESQKGEDFAANRTILALRLRYLEHQLPHVLAFYQRFYNSLLELDGFKSKWYMEDRALSAIQANMDARQQFARSYCYQSADDEEAQRPCRLADIHCDRALMKASLSQFAYFCPVTWKNTKQLVKCTQDPENTLFFKHVFYYFRTPAERELFASNPARFTKNVIFSSQKGIPLRLKPHKAAEIIAQEKALLGHCPVTLVDSDRVVKGDPLLVVQYKDQKFSFESEANLQSFLLTPGRYHNKQLPVTMPPLEDPVNLFTLQGGVESTTFMEQALGSIVTRGLREVSENRLKYPNLSVKETMLKLFALFLKAENPANTPYMKEKYLGRMRQFVERCEMAEELDDLSREKLKKQPEGKWPDFKEKYYNELGAKYDEVLALSLKEKASGFQSYLR